MKPALTRRKLLAAAVAALPARAAARKTVYVVPNFHPASCGWLTNFSRERVYCANSYLDHLDRVRDDPHYAFALSECNNLIAIMNFQPARVDELRRRIREGRVELVNGFFLESTINLSGGEALVRLGIEGLRWQQRVFGVRPRFAWTIDVCGTHDQMAQIASGLGFEAMVYTRKNPTGSTIHWAESPDGSRILALSPGHYSELHTVMAAKDPLTEKQLEEIGSYFEQKSKITPAGAPILVLAGSGDYSLAPARKSYPSEFLDQWRQFQPATEVRFTTPGRYLDAILPGIRSGEIRLRVMRGGTAYDFNSFWIQNPRVKSWYRRAEHKLQAAEMLATAASLKAAFRYPAEDLYHAWIELCLNMDRNTLWGAAGGMVFEHNRSWDVRDRFESVESIAGKVLDAAGRALGIAPEAKPPATPRAIPLPETIETKHYSARVAAATGALVSLKLKPSGREILGGPANVLVAEYPRVQRADPGDHMAPRAERVRLASSNALPSQVSAFDDPLAITVEVTGRFYGGGPSRRVMRFLKDQPLIECETELNDIPDRTVVVAEFPLAESITEVRRGIPYGFSHGAWDRPNPDLHGWTRGIVPAVRWSHYALAGGGGVAILDRGLTGRELTGRTPVLFLLNATDRYNGYPNAWLSGKGRHVLSYALVAHESEWRQARIPHLAWEYNCQPSGADSYLQASDNVIVESMRRAGHFIELRLVECLGYQGTAEITLSLPHSQALLTDMLGGDAKPLAGEPAYHFPIRAQQIVTLRFRTDSAVAEPEPLVEWDALAPPDKRAALHEYSNDKGHPPRGN